MKIAHEGPFGAHYRAGSGTTFRLWAPSQATVALQLGVDRSGARAMARSADGWHALTVVDAGPGTRYGFVVGPGPAVPDPASRFNPDDVHGLSEVVDGRAHEWQDGGWLGRPWHDAVIYELHVGTFTPAGTFAAASERLVELAELGVTAVELMPVADFPGARNWGYDGVLHYAPDASYGTPAELKAFVERAHGLGLMVLLDVVYNHFGPDGNYLHGYCPEFFNPRHQTPWGAAINFDGVRCEVVREFYIHNALHWVEEYRFDGLRLDAVHAIADDSPRHIVLDIAEALQHGPGRDRRIHLVLENERNQTSLLRARAGEAIGADAQWNDDLHHAAHVLLSGETDSYYADYAAAPAADLARALAEGFVFQGQPSPFRSGRPHGEPSHALPSTAFVSFLQNHDQIGNRAFGERIDRLASAARLDAAYACLLLSPHVPMLFMGEEFAASTPFLYFCDFGGELARAVSTGRRAEFGRFAAFADPAAQARIPDPIALTTFERSRLLWPERSEGDHARRLELVRRLLALRRERLVPLLGDGLANGRFAVAGSAFRVDWTLADGSRWWMHANLGGTSIDVALPAGAETIFATAPVPTPAPNMIALAESSVWIGRSTP